MELEDQQAFMTYLQPSESLQWVGKPPGGLLFRKSDFLVIPLSLVWGGFAVFWEVAAYLADAPPAFLLFGVPFVLIGLQITIGRFFTDMIMRQHTLYALTNDRALFLTGIFSRSLRSLDLKSVPEIVLQPGRDGRGTIVFGGGNIVRSSLDGTMLPVARKMRVPQFELIENVEQVYRMVQAAQRR